MTTDLLPALTAHLTATVHPGNRVCHCPTTTLAAREDATVVRHAGTVAKAHAPDADPTELTRRLTVATRLPGTLLPRSPRPPQHCADASSPAGRTAPPWTRTTPTPPLGSRGHPPRPPPPHPRPHRRTPMRGPAKAARAIELLRATAPHHPATTPVLDAWAALPPWARDEAPMPDTTTLCHGDFHLGQLIRHPEHHGWLLIDVDDLGTGVPEWDLARPAAWYACGLLTPDEWHRFLTAYRAAGGTAVPPAGDPWTALDVPARALTAQTAARSVTKAVAAGRPLDEVERSLVDACARMGSVSLSSPGS
ncbi:aminoglycoside phosphotransferase family protein [Streptomyces sp. KM77-8]|uniref:Aminoglycoside phosphotransferase family protein n=1 Tax=Streptomyces haneummycinicus TaxID=3074435 RepID=A0AAT9HRM9_9ACTN